MAHSTYSTISYMTNVNWDCTDYVFDKQQIQNDFIAQNLNRLCAMIKLRNLPDDMKDDEKYIKIGLLVHGFGLGIECEGKRYVLQGALGGNLHGDAPLSAYRQPLEAIIVNPYLNLDNQNYRLGIDATLIDCDSCRTGILPTMSKYGNILSEALITLIQNVILSRDPETLVAYDDSQYESAIEYLNKLHDGELGVITAGETEKSKFKELAGLTEQTTPPDRIKRSNLSMSSFSDCIELIQYVTASFYNEIGLQANYNMKREAINSNEAQMNNDALKPYIDDLIDNWTEGFNRFNEMFGTDIKVEIDSALKDNELEEEMILKDGEQNEENVEGNVEGNVGDSEGLFGRAIRSLGF